MATLAERLELGPNEFAFYFETKVGVDADALANFLKRAATVARQRGGELRVVGFREGSLAVIIEAIKRSKVGRAAAEEFYKKPIDTTIKVSGFVGGIVYAIVQAMSPAHREHTHSEGRCQSSGKAPGHADNDCDKHYEHDCHEPDDRDEGARGR